MSNCIIPGCEEEAYYIHLQCCKACYAGLRTWRGRNKHDKDHRLYLNRRLAARMEFIIGHPRHVPKRMKKR